MIDSFFDLIINNKIILTILGLDTIRAFLASTGIVDRNMPVIGRILYGKYAEDTLVSALKSLGYGKKETKSIIARMKNQKKDVNDFPKKITAGQLLNILSKYTIEFQNEISYGMIAKEKRVSYSKYYINTMDAVHNNSTLDDLVLCMTRLIKKHAHKVDYIIVPKGGNPLLAQRLAEKLDIGLVIAKDQNDSARPPESGGIEEKEKIFAIRYEGIKDILEKNRAGKKQKGILIDCNTSGGTQLLNIVKEYNSYIQEGYEGISPISKVFVLFKLVKIDPATKQEVKIDQTFHDINCTLYRFFDLDEADKTALAALPDDDYRVNETKIDQIIETISSKNRFYF